MIIKSPSSSQLNVSTQELEEIQQMAEGEPSVSWHTLLPTTWQDLVQAPSPIPPQAGHLGPGPIPQTAAGRPSPGPVPYFAAGRPSPGPITHFAAGRPSPGPGPVPHLAAGQPSPGPSPIPTAAPLEGSHP